MHWVIAGAGTAGAVVARRLAEHGHDTVTVIEQGPDMTAATAPPAVRDLDFTAALATERLDRSHVVRRRRGGQLEPYPVGRGVGGSGVVNGMLMEQGDTEQYRSWGWDDTDEAFSRVEVPSTRVPEELLGPLDRALLATEPSARRVALAQRDGRRVTVADAYLDPARARPNVTVRTATAVREVAWHGRRATGVVLDDGAVVEGDAVVLCAGALVSPVILLRSGVHDVPVGEGLQDHPSATVTVRLRASGHAMGDTEAADDDDGSDLRIESSLRQTTVASGAVAGDGDVQLTVMNHVGATPDLRCFGTVTAAVLRPHSRGSVALDRSGAPRIEMNELDDTRDLELLAGAVERLRTLVAAPAFAELIDDIDGGGVTIDESGTTLSSLRSRADVETWLPSRPVGGTYLHAAASCPMGRVVDGSGKVLGRDNLFVVDASIFPAVPAAPTYLPTLMLAERMARRLRSR